MRKVRIGCDIGSKGAIAIFINGELEMSAAFPLTAGKPDMKKFLDILTDWIKEDDNIHAVIEDLHSIFGTSAKSNFSFGWINGSIETSLIACGIPYTKIGAKKWQKQMWEGIRPVETLVKGKANKDGSPKYKIDTKGTSLLAAKRLFPNETFLATERSSVPHDGIVDSILLGKYAVLNF